MRDTARVGLLALTLAGCGDGDPTHPGGAGTVEVTTASTGQGLDTDGYIVEVVGYRTLEIGTNGTETLTEVPAGDREVRLTGVRANCTVEAPHPRLIRVVAGETFRTEFEVVCAHTPLLGRIVFTSYRDGTRELYSMNVDGSDPVRLTDTPEEEREVFPAVSPDGSKILFVNRIGPYEDFYTGYLYVMNADGTNRVRLPPLDTPDPVAPVWSPDGSQFAFHDWDEIWVMDADGTGLRNLTNTPGDQEYFPSWSPDGQRILYTAGDPTRIEVMNADGTGRARFADDANWASWSPDGTRIALLSRGRLYTINADGSDLAPLTADGGHVASASWSPSGDRLAYIRIVDPDVEVYVINADGTGAVNISNNDTHEFIGPQAWGP